MPQPIPRMLQPLILTLARATDRQLARTIEYMKAENQLLRSRIDGPIRLKPQERRILLKYGLPLGAELKKIISIVRYETFRKWARAKPESRPRAKVGSPRTSDEIRALVVRLASETGWGVNRILGELKKLGIESLSRTTVRNILREHGLGTGPDRGKSTWDEWVKAHAETLWACDFFSKRVLTLRGIKTCYALAFIHLKTRRVIATPSTLKPTRAWSAFHAGWFLDRVRKLRLAPPEIVIRDGDGKYGAPFNQALRERGCRAKRIPPRSPNLNALVERWVKSVKVECLDHFVILGTDHFDHLVAEYLEHYHEERHHQGIGNRVIDANAPPLTIPGAIECHERLGGVLKSYRPQAA